MAASPIREKDVFVVVTGQAVLLLQNLAGLNLGGSILDDTLLP